jgi:hypothetical protein
MTVPTPPEGAAAPGARPPADPAALLNALNALPDDAAVAVDAVALTLACSARHVWRMSDAGLMPAPLALGKLRRWRVGTLRDWLRRGCPPVRPQTGRSGR